jgi:flagellar motor switch protein FliM
MADNFLSQEEVDALLKGVNGDQDDVAAPEDTSGVRTYNLATQERIVRGRMPTLEIINERFARYLRGCRSTANSSATWWCRPT